MAVKVTTDDIIRFNKLYYECKNYSQVARETGFSASTVKKYIDKNWHPINDSEKIKFDTALIKDFKGTAFIGIENYGDLCVLSDKEKDLMEQLWKEIEI